MASQSRGKVTLSAHASLACLFAALCCAGAYISIPIPIGPVPLTLANFFSILGGLLLGPLWGAISVGLYIVVGTLGFPVFSGGRGGIAHLAGPTGGYLVGYCVGAALSGLISGRWGKLSYVLGSFAGFALILFLGACGLVLITGISWERALIIGILPFLPGDTIKAILAAIIAIQLGPFVDSLTSRHDPHD